MAHDSDENEIDLEAERERLLQMMENAKLLLKTVERLIAERKTQPQLHRVWPPPEES